MYQLFPTPEHFTVTEAHIPAGRPVLSMALALQDACRAAGYDPQRNLAEFLTAADGTLPITAELTDGVSGAFAMEIQPSGTVHIHCADGAGLYYAVEALHQPS